MGTLNLVEKIIYSCTLLTIVSIVLWILYFATINYVLIIFLGLHIFIIPGTLYGFDLTVKQVIYKIYQSNKLGIPIRHRKKIQYNPHDELRRCCRCEDMNSQEKIIYNTNETCSKCRGDGLWWNKTHAEICSYVKQRCWRFRDTDFCSPGYISREAKYPICNIAKF